MRRRAFLGIIGAGASGFAAGVLPTLRAAAASTIPRRPLGRTGLDVPIIGFPGLGLIHDEQSICTELVHAAVDAGVNYLDVAPAYGKGDCEIKMGIGLQGIPRHTYFLACKTKMRDAAGCTEELNRSLVRLKTDHFDLYQLHCLMKVEEVDQALGPGGAMEVILKAREQGKIRHIGFSAHTTVAALAAMKKFQFDTVMFPISYVEYFKIGFGKEVLALAREQNAAVLAIKPLAGGAWAPDAKRTRKWWYRPIDDPAEANLALRFTLSQPAVTAGMPPAWPDIFRQAIGIARDYRPITAQETSKLESMAAAGFSVFEKQQKTASAHDYGHDPFGCGESLA
ncbi:MAG TPA: aldo/keto reductase [Verrucomicrobiae bacterium]|nr:aldo/keto reductase [Verrucomicrobiae bacterium]